MHSIRQYDVPLHKYMAMMELEVSLKTYTRIFIFFIFISKYLLYLQHILMYNLYLESFDSYSISDISYFNYNKL